MTAVLISGGKCSVKTQTPRANTMWRQTKSSEWFSYKPRYSWNCQNLEKARKEGSSPWGFAGSMTLPTPSFQASGLDRTLRQYMSVLLSHPVCGTLLWQFWETKARLPSPLPPPRPGAPSSLLKSCPGPQRRVTWDYLTLGICKLSHNVDMEDICRNWILYGNLEVILIT